MRKRIVARATMERFMGIRFPRRRFQNDETNEDVDLDLGINDASKSRWFSRMRVMRTETRAMVTRKRGDERRAGDERASERPGERAWNHHTRARDWNAR